MSGDTRQRVLESACASFAQKGYRGTTVAEICEAAGANIAAVNYYFRSKERLYHEVWRHARNVAADAHDSSADAEDPEAWLRAHIRARIESIFDRGAGGWFARILQREMTDPTPMEEKLRAEFLRPRIMELEKVVERMLGKAAGKKQVRFCTLNVLSLYAFPNMARLPRRRLFGRPHPGKAQIETLIAQTQEFALAGVRGVGDAIRKGRKK